MPPRWGSIHETVEPKTSTPNLSGNPDVGADGDCVDSGGSKSYYLLATMM